MLAFQAIICPKSLVAAPGPRVKIVKHQSVARNLNNNAISAYDASGRRTQETVGNCYKAEHGFTRGGEAPNYGKLQAAPAPLRKAHH
jgi:hypothetical protein